MRAADCKTTQLGLTEAAIKWRLHNGAGGFRNAMTVVQMLFMAIAVWLISLPPTVVAAQDRLPDAPGRPVGNGVFIGGVDLEWNDVSGADTYDVQSYLSGQWVDLPGNGVEIAFYGAGAIVSGLDPTSTLWFRVRARNSHGSSNWSDWAQMPSTDQYELGLRPRPDNAPASGSPVIKGSAQVGESLTTDVTGIEDGNGLDRVQFRFKWVFSDGGGDTDIAGATDSTYILTAADEGKTVNVRVIFTDRGGYEESLLSGGTEQVTSSQQGNSAPTPEPSQNSPATGVPTITGTAQVGETLAVDVSGIADADGMNNATFSYQWVANDGNSDADIAGATNSTYTLADSDAGKTIKARVTFTDDGGNAEALTSAVTTAVAKPPLTATFEYVPESHDGQNAFTFELRFSEEPALSYATLRDSAFTVTDGDVTKARRLERPSNIRWMITVSPHSDADVTITLPATTDCVESGAVCTKDGRELSSAVSVTIPGPVQNSPATGVPTITGTAQVGETLTADTSGIADADGMNNATFSYQWVANDGSSDTDITGATNSTYILADSDVGKTTKVRVSFTDDAGHAETLTSAATSAVAARPNSAATGSPTISGELQAGETLTADTSGIADADGMNNATFTYQWIANYGSSDTDIADATNSTYTLADSDVSKTIKVRVSFTDDAGHAETLTSAATSAEVTRPNSAATGSPTISGTLQVGETLTADTSGITDADGMNNATFSYQWIANDGSSDRDIAGATNSTYTLEDSDMSKTIKVRVSFTDDAGHAETLTSAATSPVTNRDVTGMTEPLSITGNDSPEYPENESTGVAEYTVEPADLSVDWSLTGDDSAVFSIADGVLEFLSPPNYERPTDQDGNNEYEVQVVATDSNDTSATRTVTVTVTDVLDPNVVLILADDAGYEVFGVNGSTQYSTSKIDNLASGGVRFTNAHSKPCCAPSRVALMTGKSNIRNYVDQGLLPRNEYVIVDPFREAGYATAIAGKWRLHGFTRNDSGVAGGVGFDTYCLWGTANTTMDRYRNASVECDGQVTQLGADEFAPDFFVGFLLEFMESNRDRPLFAYYPMVLAHGPSALPPGSNCHSADDQCIYEDMVSYMDSNVGRLYDKLKELDLLDNTIVVFTSDNGTRIDMVSVLGGDAIHGDRGTTRDVSTHAPLFVHVPGGTGGRVVEDLIDFTDFLPTLADAAGLTIPNRADLDGVSFWERLEGRPGQPREWLYTYYFPRPGEDSFDNPANHPEVAYARDKQYKLYHTGELFDVSADPHELYPLPDDDEVSRDNRATLQAVLDSMPDRGQGIHWPSVTGDFKEARPRWRPILSGATVNGTELMLTYAGILNTTARPEADAFTVIVGGAERAVSAVSIDPSTVTLTLDSPVTAGQSVTVSYAGGGALASIKHADRDRAHFAADLTDRAVTNVTNRPSTGVPLITGTAQVGETLTADTSGITDADGMNNATFSYQWIANDGSSDRDIAGATNSSYILLAAEEGKSVKVRVSFTDDSDNDETLTSDATAAVAAGELDVIWSVEMLVKDYGNGSEGAYSADLFSNETGSLRIKWLWYHEPSRKLYLAFGDAVADSEYLTLQVSDVAIAFPPGDSSFTFRDVDFAWSAGQTLAVRIVRQGESDAP